MGSSVEMGYMKVMDTLEPDQRKNNVLIDGLGELLKLGLQSLRSVCINDQHCVELAAMKFEGKPSPFEVLIREDLHHCYLQTFKPDGSRTRSQLLTWSWMVYLPLDFTMASAGVVLERALLMNCKVED